MLEMQVNMILQRSNTPALAYLNRHRPRDNIARCQILGRWRIAFHEPLACRIREIAAFAAGTLGNQTAHAINAGGVKLHKFHILQRQTGAQHHAIAVARAGMGRRRREIGAAITAGCQNCLMGAETVNGAIFHRECHHAAAHTIFHDQIKGKILDEEFRLVAQRLAIQRMQHGMARAVGSSAGALGRRAVAEILHHAAERALINPAILRARERHAEMLKFVNGGGRMAAEIFNGVLIAQPVRALHRVIHVPAPVVGPHVAKRSRNAALRRHRMRARGKHF